MQCFLKSGEIMIRREIVRTVSRFSPPEKTMTRSAQPTRTLRASTPRDDALPRRITSPSRATRMIQ